uniref:Uncharacterized protein n=1 Tax=Rhizophora mucronata TaxID=61149 RepID=A0A2P2NW49_RHIMU
MHKSENHLPLTPLSKLHVRVLIYYCELLLSNIT